jgi:hypothetical protein
VRQGISAFPPFIFDNFDVEMSDELETQPLLTNRMDDAFCARMRWAIQAGLESAPIGVVSTPGTKNPKCLAAEPRPLVSSQRAMEYA